MQPPFCLLRLKSKRLFLWILGVENACVLHAASGDAGDRTPDFSHAKRTLYHWVTSPTNVTAVTVETLLQLTFIPSQSITNVFPHINYIYYTYTRYMHYSSIIFFSPSLITTSFYSSCQQFLMLIVHSSFVYCLANRAQTQKTYERSSVERLDAWSCWLDNWRVHNVQVQGDTTVQGGKCKSVIQIGRWPAHRFC